MSFDFALTGPWQALVTGALPYVEIPPLELGPLKFYPFGFLVGVASVVGTIVAGRRGRKVGLDERIIAELALWAVIPGMIVAHLYSAIFYFPERIVEDPLYLVKIWDGISSFGGFIGGSLGVFYYLRRHRIPFWPYADVILFGFAFAWIFGRMGCTVAFDHPGLASDFALAMPYPREIDAEPAGTVRHNLGFYEFLWTLVICAVLWARRNAPQRAGWTMGIVLVLYTPVRFGFDFLRRVDATYAGMTAGQYAAIVGFGLGLWILFRKLPENDLLVPDGQVHVFADGTPAIAAAGQARSAAKKPART